MRTRGCHVSNKPLPCYEDDCIDYNFANSLFDFSDWDFTTYHSLPNFSLVGSLPIYTHAEIDFGRKKNQIHFSLLVMITLLLALGVRLDKKMPYEVFELWKVKDVVVADKSVCYINGSPITHRLAPSRTSNTDSA